MSDVAEIFSDTRVVELVVSQVPALSEVVIAAADSYLPVAALQYLIDGVHSFTGLNWWASIAITTILIRTAIFPLMINQMKATSKLVGNFLQCLISALCYFLPIACVLKVDALVL